MGKTPKDQAELDLFFSGIQEEKILWYPSAGNDFRDILEMTPSRLRLHGISEAPNIICHTDYADSGMTIDVNKLILHQDTRTTVRLVKKCDVVLRPDIDFTHYIDPEYVSFPCSLYDRPFIYFITLKITSKTLGEIYANVFYFKFENYNFLEQIILKNDITITHFVKVRGGCGFGGNRKCISVFYSLLGHVGVKYLLVDNEIHYCRITHDKMALNIMNHHKRYKLSNIGTTLSWSGYKVKAFEVIPDDGYLQQEELFILLMQIAGTYKIDIL